MKLSAKTRKIFPVIMFVVFGTLLTLYLSTIFQYDVSSSQDSMNSMEVSKVEGNTKAPDFVLQDPEGKSYRLRDFRGNVVMINFWTTW